MSSVSPSFESPTNRVSRRRRVTTSIAGILVGGMVIVPALSLPSYARDINLARSRLTGIPTEIYRSQVGDVEYRLEGKGPVVLVSHGVTGGIDHGMRLTHEFGFFAMTIGFGLGLFALIRSTRHMPAGEGVTLGSTGALILVAEGAFGLATIFFPQDPVGAPATSTGGVHIVLAGLSSVTTMAAMLLVGLWLRGTPPLRGLGSYSLISVVVVFLSGGLAAATIANPSPIAGIVERITIGAFLQWLFVVALATSRRYAA